MLYPLSYGAATTGRSLTWADSGRERCRLSVNRLEAGIFRSYNRLMTKSINTRMAADARSKCRQFRDLLTSPTLEFLCEAHNGLSARIVEEAGFKGLWASGLAISAALGVRDNNEASWTQVLEVTEFMADASSVPIMLDGDTGYGNFNNMRRLVQKLESRGIAAVCIEDKLFPKTNSFIKGEAQPLADIDEFCGKIRAGKAAQRDLDFSIIARVEAFIAGWGLDEAIRRAEAYRAAGADGILIHSAKSTPDEILAFLREWDNRAPVVLVPTKYYTTPTEVFRDHGVSMVIWANHIVRASIRAMQQAASTIRAEGNLLGVEHAIAPVSEIFRLQGADELDDAERLYLPKRDGSRAIILAAARGRELGPLTEEEPKAMLQVGNKPILAHIADTYRRAGIKDITAVRGFAREKVNLAGIRYVDNEAFDSTGEVVSLAAALDAPDDLDDLADQDGEMTVSYGDVLFRRHVLDMLADTEADIIIAVDTNWQASRNRGSHRRADYVTCSLPNSRRAYTSEVNLVEMAPAPEGRIHGEWMGIARFSAGGLAAVRAAVAAWKAEAGAAYRTASMNDLFNRLAAAGLAVRVVYTTGHWLDIDEVDDLVLAGSFV